jgi:hypothetical protein
MERKKADRLRNNKKKGIRMSNESDDAMVEQGNDAETLLNSDAFNRTVNSIVDATFQTFVNSQYPEKEKRDTSHAHYRALVDLVSTLKERVSVRDEIMAKIERDNRETEERVDH